MTARDGTVGRFAIPPSAVTGVVPQSNVAALGEPAKALLPQSLKAPAQAAPVAVAPKAASPLASPLASPATSPSTRPAAPQTAASDVLFSQTVDKDPGCYLHLARCERRCNTTAPKFSLFRQTLSQCRAKCRSTYICAK